MTKQAASRDSWQIVDKTLDELTSTVTQRTSAFRWITLTSCCFSFGLLFKVNPKKPYKILFLSITPSSNHVKHWAGNSFIATLPPCHPPNLPADPPTPEKRIGFKMEALLGRDSLKPNAPLFRLSSREFPAQCPIQCPFPFSKKKKASRDSWSDRRQNTVELISTTTRRRKDSAELLSRHASF